MLQSEQTIDKVNLDLQKRVGSQPSTVDSSGQVTENTLATKSSIETRASRAEEKDILLIPLSSIKTENSDEQQRSSQDTPRKEKNLCKTNLDFYACSKCGIKFPARTMLNRHKISHNNRLRNRYLQNTYIHLLKSNLKKRNKQAKVKEQLEKYEYVCKLCGFGCNRRVTLTMHTRKKHKTNEAKAVSVDISCSLCSSTFGGPAALKKHMNEHKSAKYFSCEKCNFECKRSSTLASHIVRNHEKPITKRELAPKKRCKTLKTDRTNLEEDCTKASAIPVKEEIEEMTANVISQEVLGRPTCIQVTAESPESSRTVKKQPKKTSGEPIKCNLCDFKCSTKGSLYAHKRQHKAENHPEVYSCNECGFKTSKKSSLYSHIKRKHKIAKSGTGDEQPELFYCSQCDYKNKNKYELKVHVLRKHTDDFKFSCETCGKKFKVKGDLTNHVRFTHKEQPVICDVCGKTCLNSNSLYVHQKFAHYKAKYECPVCKRRMVSQENLNEHMLRQHEKRESVVCEQCGKTFSRNSRLKVHRRIHTGDKPYSCTICSKSFARRTALKQHLLIHTGIRPYVCDICGKAFTQKPGLISHRKSHPGTHPPLPRVLIDHILNDVMNN